MRIIISHHTNTLATRRAQRQPHRGSTAARWAVSPANERYEDYSVHLEIDHDFSGDPDRITRVVSVMGEMKELINDAEYASRIQAILEHEDTTRDEAKQWIDENHDVITEREFRTAMGGDVKVFEEMEWAWHAVSEFVDFAVTF